MLPIGNNSNIDDLFDDPAFAQSFGFELDPEPSPHSGIPPQVNLEDNSDLDALVEPTTLASESDPVPEPKPEPNPDPTLQDNTEDDSCTDSLFDPTGLDEESDPSFEPTPQDKKEDIKRELGAEEYVPQDEQEVDDAPAELSPPSLPDLPFQPEEHGLVKGIPQNVRLKFNTTIASTRIANETSSFAEATTNCKHSTKRKSSSLESDDTKEEKPKSKRVGSIQRPMISRRNAQQFPLIVVNNNPVTNHNPIINNNPVTNHDSVINQNQNSVNHNPQNKQTNNYQTVPDTKTMNVSTPNTTGSQRELDMNQGSVPRSEGRFANKIATNDRILTNAKNFRLRNSHQNIEDPNSQPRRRSGVVDNGGGPTSSVNAGNRPMGNAGLQQQQHQCNEQHMDTMHRYLQAENMQPDLRQPQQAPLTVMNNHYFEYQQRSMQHQPAPFTGLNSQFESQHREWHAVNHQILPPQNAFHQHPHAMDIHNQMLHQQAPPGNMNIHFNPQHQEWQAIDHQFQQAGSQDAFHQHMQAMGIPNSMQSRQMPLAHTKGQFDPEYQNWQEFNPHIQHEGQYTFPQQPHPQHLQQPPHNTMVWLEFDPHLHQAGPSYPGQQRQQPPQNIDMARQQQRHQPQTPGMHHQSPATFENPQAATPRATPMIHRATPRMPKSQEKRVKAPARE